MISKKDIYLYSLASLFIIGSFVMFYVLRQETGIVAVGVVDTLKVCDVLILSYFFGSSKGSADKTESLNKAAEELARNSVIKTTEETIIKTN